MFDGKAFGQEVVDVVKDYVERQAAPLLKRIQELEEALAAMPAPVDGKNGEAGRDGRDGPTVEDLAPMIAAAVEKAVAAIPAPEPGKDGLDGKDGRDGPTVDDLAGLVSAEVEKAVAAIPLPKDGKDGDRGERGLDGENGKDGADGRDGVGLAGALIDRAGSLVVTLTDGTTRNLGPVVGKDGDRGERGSDGLDGIGFDDLDVLYDGERQFSMRWTKGDRIVERSFDLPVVLDRGVFKEGESYLPGDGVTWGGSFWIAQTETREKPDGGGKGWRLSVKRGRDGRDGVVKTESPPKPVKVGVPSKDSAK